MNARLKHTGSYLLVLLGVAMVSYSGPLVKLALQEGANAVSIAMMRMALSAVMTLPLLLRRRDDGLLITKALKLSGRERLWSFLSSVCLALHYFTWMTSLGSTSTFASVALVCTQPLFVAALSGLLLHEPIPRKARPGALIALAGAVVIGLDSLSGAAGELGGDLLALLGAACMAGHWLCNRYTRRSMEALVCTFLIYVQTSLLLLCLMPFSGGFCLPGNAIWYVVLLAGGCTMLGHTMFTVALGRVPATVVSFVLLGEPVGAMLWSMGLFGEIPGPWLLTGGAVVLLGLVCYTAAEVRQDPTSGAK